jgi:hypothetical protein
MCEGFCVFGSIRHEDEAIAGDGLEKVVTDEAIGVSGMPEQDCVGENRILAFGSCNNLGGDTPCSEEAVICVAVGAIVKPVSCSHCHYSLRFENSDIAKSAMIEHHLLNLRHFKGTYPESSLRAEFEGIGPWDISSQVRLLRHLTFEIICLSDGFAI